MNIDIEYIKQELKSRKITYQQLSEKSGVPVSTIKKIFSNETANPRLETLKSIRDAINIPAIEEYPWPDTKELMVKNITLLQLAKKLDPEKLDQLIKFAEFLNKKSDE